MKFPKILIAIALVCLALLIRSWYVNNKTEALITQNFIVHDEISSGILAILSTERAINFQLDHRRAARLSYDPSDDIAFLNSKGAELFIRRAAAFSEEHALAAQMLAELSLLEDLNLIRMAASKPLVGAGEKINLFVDESIQLQHSLVDHEYLAELRNRFIDHSDLLILRTNDSLIAKTAALDVEAEESARVIFASFTGLLVVFAIILLGFFRAHFRINSELQISEEKDKFLANMSHEMRTPLNSILGISSVMADDSLVPDEIRNEANIIQRSASHLLELVNDILDLAHIESGNVPLLVQPVNIASLLKHLEETLSARAIEKGLTLSVSSNVANDTYYSADPVRLNQILLNLLGNAIKFTNQGGVSLDVVANDQTMTFSVADTGPGISEKEQALLFDRFKQLEHAKRNAISGSGLGLAICKQLTELMGGTITVESMPERGSTFIVAIPLPACPPPQEPMRRIDLTDTDFSTLRVLVVDDNVENRFVLKRMLRGRVNTLELASNGLEALELLTIGNFDIVLMDCQMPVMDGYEATRQIRQGFAGTDAMHVPIIACSAHALPNHAQASIAAGMNAHIAKPITKAKVDEILAQYAFGDKDEEFSTQVTETKN